MKDQKNCADCAIKAAWVGVGISLVLALMKYYIGWVGGSAGVMAAAIHSTVCLISSASILFTQSFAGRRPDARYAYGYGKIEFVASAVVNTSVLVIMTFFMISNVRALLQELHHVPHVTSAIVAATTTPLPAARPSALMTIGAPLLSTWAWAWLASAKVAKPAVGMP